MTEPPTVSTPRAPAPVGPYAQARWAGRLLFISGQVGLSPETGSLAGPGLEEQAAQALDNLQAILAAADLGWEQVVKVTVFLTDMADFPALNQVYGQRLAGLEALPARACVAVAGLPAGARVEIEAVARRG